MSSTFLGVDISGTDTSGSSMSPSKKLQHAILQLCNEYITYDRTLQVLGVICLTVDDQQPEILVKVNNTLKRFKEPDSLTLINSLQKADAKAAQLLNLSNSLTPKNIPESSGSKSCSAKTSTNQGSGTRSKVTQRSGKSVRKGHGRKQSNPLKVSHAQFDYVNEHSSGDDRTKNKEIHETNPLEAPNAGDAADDNQNNDGDLDENDLDSQSRKRQMEEVESTEEIPNKLARFPDDDLEYHDDNEETVMEADSDEDLKRLVIIEPLEGNLEAEELENDCDVPNFEDANFSEVGSEQDSGLRATDIIHIKEEPGEEAGTTELERLLKIEKPKQKNVLDESRYRVESRLIQTIAPMTRQLLPATSALLSNQIFAILPSATNIQQQAQTSGLARLLQPTTFYTVTDKNVQSSANNCFSLQLTQMAKNVLKLPDGAAQAVANQIPIIKNSTPNQGNSLHTSLITLNKQQSNESDYLLDSFAAEPELLTKIGLKSSTLTTDPNSSRRAHRRRIYEDVLTPEEIVEYVGSTDEAISSAALQRPYKCSCCDKTLHNLLEYFRHTLKIHNAFVCHQCGKDFTTKSSLLRHRPIHTGLRRFACGICQKSFYRKDKCKAHIKMHFRSGFSTQPSAASTASAAIVPSGITTQLVSLPTFVVPQSEGTLG